MILLCASQVECTTGVVKWYNKEKGYGYITVDGTNKDAIVFQSDVKIKTLYAGERVQFDLVVQNKGLRAIRVRHVSGE